MKLLLLSILCCIFITILLYRLEDQVLFSRQIISRYIPIQIIQQTNITGINNTKTIGQSKKFKTKINRLHKTNVNNKERKKYSSFVCLGADSSTKINNYRKQYGALLQHTCHFKNICYSNKRNKWLYYALPSSSEIIQTEGDNIYFDFNTTKFGFLMIHSMKNEVITPMIIHEAFPEQNKIYKMFDKTVIYHYLQWIYNFGHVLTDNFYSMYRALHYFHLYDNNTCCQPLFNYLWQAAGFQHAINTNSLFLPIKFITGLNEYIFNETKPIFLSFDSRKQPGRDLHVEQEYERLFAVNDSLNDLACFKNIVIGTDDFRIWWKAIMRKFHHRWDFSNFLNLFRKHPFHIDEYNKYSNENMMKPKQKILFISKDDGERRRWTNDTNVSFIIEYLVDLFGVEIDSMQGFDIYSGKTMRQQIDFILPYTLVITACGAVSYIGAFMRSGTAMITVDYWHMKDEKSSHIDSYIWEYLSDRKTYYYYIKSDEWEMPTEWTMPNRNHRGEKGKLLLEDVRNNADYRLKAPRLSKYVYSALLWIEHYNGWESNTFKRPPIFPIDEIE